MPAGLNNYITHVKKYLQTLYIAELQPFVWISTQLIM